LSSKRPAIRPTREGGERLRAEPTACRQRRTPSSNALAYNLANFMHMLVLPEEAEHWSLTTLRENR
jgi:hypothetical protein